MCSLQSGLLTKDRETCVQIFPQAVAASSEVEAKFRQFKQECIQKSELCYYSEFFFNIVEVVLALITADRDGDWLLHVSALATSMPIFREFDAFNYMRYGSWY